MIKKFVAFILVTQITTSPILTHLPHNFAKVLTLAARAARGRNEILTQAYASAVFNLIHGFNQANNHDERSETWNRFFTETEVNSFEIGKSIAETHGIIMPEHAPRALGRTMLGILGEYVPRESIKEAAIEDGQCTRIGINNQFLYNPIALQHVPAHLHPAFLLTGAMAVKNKSEATINEANSWERPTIETLIITRDTVQALDACVKHGIFEPEELGAVGLSMIAFGINAVHNSFLENCSDSLLGIPTGFGKLPVNPEEFLDGSVMATDRTGLALSSYPFRSFVESYK